ncbi:hypothetical protein I3843_16G045800 [Carya illinoinensis]|nr:hypothetical protein I3843_16G045800 [Carya illinoinensis]
MHTSLFPVTILSLPSHDALRPKCRFPLTSLLLPLTRLSFFFSLTPSFAGLTLCPHSIPSTRVSDSSPSPLTTSQCECVQQPH